MGDIVIRIKPSYFYALFLVIVTFGITIVYAQAPNPGHPFGELEGVQARIAQGMSQCAGANQAIKTIDPDTGAVTCEPDDVGSPGMGGGGTTNYIPKFTGPTTLGNSLMYESGGNVQVSNGLTAQGPITTSQLLSSTWWVQGVQGVEAGQSGGVQGDLKFHGEIMPDGALCSNGQILQKISSDNWDCVSAGGGGDITAVYAGSGLTGGGTSGAVTLNIGTGAVTASHLGPNSVGSSEIASNSIYSVDIIDGQIGQLDIGANQVNQGHLAASSVGSTQIQTGAVFSSDIADNSITSADLASNSVYASEIAAGAVGNSELASSSVTSSKLSLTRYLSPYCTDSTTTGGQVVCIIGSDSTFEYCGLNTVVMDKGWCIVNRGATNWEIWSQKDSGASRNTQCSARCIYS